MMTKAYQLHAQISGTGSPVVLLHGFLASSAYWTSFAQLLSKEHMVITIDLLGFGKSPKPRLSRYGYMTQLSSIDYTLKQLGVKEPVTLVGHSMGSLLALRYSRQFASQVKKLVLLNMPIMLSKKEVKKEIYGISLTFRFGLNRLFHRALWSLFKVLYKLQWLPEKLNAALKGRLAYIFQNSARSRLLSFQNIIADSTVQQDLAAVTVPTTLVHGAQDRPLYLHNIQHLPAKKGILHAIIKGGHHLPHSSSAQLLPFITTT